MFFSSFKTFYKFLYFTINKTNIIDSEDFYNKKTGCGLDKDTCLIFLYF